MADGGGGSYVEIVGLRPLLRDLKQFEPAVYRDLRKGLKDAGQIVATEAKHNAEHLYRVRTGALRDKITPAVQQTAVLVRAKAKSKHDGYDYPGRLEYTKRAFVETALQAKVNDAFDKIDDAIARAMDAAGL